MILVLFLILFIISQPHKNKLAYYNKINATFLTFLILLFSAYSGWNIARIKNHLFIKVCQVLSVIFALLPFVYMTCIIIYWIFCRRHWRRELINRLHIWRRGYDGNVENEMEALFADRLVNPEGYRQVN